MRQLPAAGGLLGKLQIGMTTKKAEAAGMVEAPAFTTGSFS
ncbi:hypothetical protein [Actinoplanes solisilvae]|nr:hypothetical protein [Actinoplanes solisilvae]